MNQATVQPAVLPINQPVRHNFPISFCSGVGLNVVTNSYFDVKIYSRVLISILIKFLITIKYN